MEFTLHVVNRKAQTPERDVCLSLPKNSIAIGRNPACDLCLDDSERMVSGQHARLDVRDGGLWVTDISRNGTYLNYAQEPLPSHQAVAIRDGDCLIIGFFEVTVNIDAQATPATSRERPRLTESLSNPSDTAAVTVSPTSRQDTLTAGSELSAFLSGLGIGNPAAIEQPDALLRHAGELLRALAAGLTQTMMGRAQLKNELRLGVTTIRASDNNPFKFAVDTDNLLEYLLLRPTPGFLSAVTAAREAYDDIQAHEMAMMAGLQAALRALFARFEPSELERRLSRGGLDQVLPTVRKARYWDLFTETYEQVAAESSEDVMQVFSDAFAHAYQDHIQRLAEARRRA